MIIDVMCRIADGPLRPGALEVTQAIAPLVSWSVNTRDASGTSDQPDDDLAIELRLPDNTVWTGEAYPSADVEPEEQIPESPEDGFSVPVKLRGTGPLRENSVPLHADVVLKRLSTMSA
ncbi:MAG TPA: hypothetical protein VFO16_21055 [Pseudonocardiaceae bacterium]|nr:hypothetical protein [Pseudonocardiaceae bacterium]